MAIYERDVSAGMKMMLWRTSLFFSANLYRVKMWSSLQTPKVRPEDDSDEELEWAQRGLQLRARPLLLWQ